MKFYLQSWSDVITNSSTEIYQEATEYTVSAVKEYKYYSKDCRV